MIIDCLKLSKIMKCNIKKLLDYWTHIIYSNRIFGMLPLNRWINFEKPFKHGLYSKNTSLIQYYAIFKKYDKIFFW